jgi:hypothetical protein
MPYAFVQQVEDDSGSTVLSAFPTPAFGASLTAGNLMVCHVWYGGWATARTVTLAGGGSPTWVEESVLSAGTEHLHSFYALNVPGGVTTAITATFSTTVDFPAIYAAEYSGFKTSSARLAFAAQHQATPGTGTDGVTSGLLGTLSEPAAGTSFTALTAVHDYGGATLGSRPEHRRVTATTSVAGTFTTTAGSAAHKTAAWAFAEAGSTTLTQEGFRFRNDDGSESAATWLAAQDTNITQPLNTNTRLRVLLDASGDPAAGTYQLEWQKVSEGVWRKVR